VAFGRRCSVVLQEVLGGVVLTRVAMTAFPIALSPHDGVEFRVNRVDEGECLGRGAVLLAGSLDGQEEAFERHVLGPHLQTCEREHGVLRGGGAVVLAGKVGCVCARHNRTPLCDGAGAPYILRSSSGWKDPHEKEKDFLLYGNLSSYSIEINKIILDVKAI
jgi:hypothetical protein